MAKISWRPYRLMKNVKMKPSFFIYALIFFILSFFLSVGTIIIVDEVVSTVAVYYVDKTGTIEKLDDDINEKIRIAIEYIDDDFDESDANAVVFYARNSVVVLLLILYFVLGIFFASHFFFKRKLHEPLKILENAAEKIAQEDLDFTVAYDGNDEMGKLCTSFEAMRRQLEENNRELWKMLDEQKRVQRVFSHDIRTPLTVTMGYVDILREYMPEGKLSEEKLEHTLELIHSNLCRLESFVTMMTTMQKLDDLQVKVRQWDVQELFSEIEENATMICWDKSCRFKGITDTALLYTDKLIIQQIAANLVSNASRFADKKVYIVCKVESGSLYLTVKDDGCGFSEDALSHVFEPYYSQQSNPNSEHFGIGLNICKTLVTMLGGKILCCNDGGARIDVIIPESPHAKEP